MYVKVTDKKKMNRHVESLSDPTEQGFLFSYLSAQKVIW